MNYTLKDLLDIPKMQDLLDSLDEMHSLPSAIVDMEGNILTATAWQNICTKFHRVNPETEKKCKESNPHIITSLIEKQQPVIYRCPLGLVDSATPIFIEGKQLGVVSTGQLFLGPPDEEYFITQAQHYGFDECEYLTAVRKVPIFSEESLKKNLTFIGKLAQMLTEQGLQLKRQQEAELALGVTERKAVEEALQESEARYRLLFDSANDAIFIHNLEADMLGVNIKACEQLSYTFDELMHLWVDRVETPEQFSKSPERLSRILEQGHYTFETVHVRKDGSLVPTEVSARLITWQGQQAIYSICRDITERKVAEEALRQSEEKYRLLFECAGDSFSVITLQGKLLTVNPLACEMLGYTYDELMAVPLDRIDTRSELLPELIGIVMERGYNFFDTEHWRKDGSTIQVSVNSRLITWDGQSAIMNICRDITQRKRTEEELRMFKVSVENATDAIGFASPEGKNIYQNEAFNELFGDIGEDPSVPYVEKNVAKDVFETIMVGGNWTGELKMYGKDRRVIDIFLRAYANKDAKGKIIGLVSIHTDITDRKKAEEERLQLERQFLNAQKLESLGIMAGGIAHDFNNLLHAISGNMEIALRELSAGSSAHRHISSALLSSDRAAHLSGLMLTYAGRDFIDKSALSLNKLVVENADMFKVAISSSITLEMNLTKDSTFILANPVQIQQVVMNLLTNASEAIATPVGHIRITTRNQHVDQKELAKSLVQEKPVEGQYIELAVIDNGCGMSEETLSRVFDPFFTTKFTGRGMGMSAVLGIVKAHSGALFVTSVVGEGTTFRVLFPASESASPPHIQEPVESRIVETASPTIELSGVALVVDDEKTVLRTCKKMMELCGFRVITASDGVDAVKKLRAHAEEIDLVIMDLTMPNMDGIAAMEEIFSMKPSVKLILSSGFNEDGLSHRITGHPPSGFIRKPYSFNVLETEIRRVMQAE